VYSVTWHGVFWNVVRCVLERGTVCSVTWHGVFWNVAWCVLQRGTVFWNVARCVLERGTVCSGRNVDIKDTSFSSLHLFVAPYAQKLLVQYSDSKFAFKQVPISVPLTDPIFKDWYLFVSNSI
jgi:hypothetical protein